MSKIPTVEVGYASANFIYDRAWEVLTTMKLIEGGLFTIVTEYCTEHIDESRAMLDTSRKTTELNHAIMEMKTLVSAIREFLEIQKIKNSKYLTEGGAA